MVTAIGRAVLTGLVVGLGVLSLHVTAEPFGPVVPTVTRTSAQTDEAGRIGCQFVPPGWTLYAPASPDEIFLRPDEGDGLIEITCRPRQPGLEPASYAARWESTSVGPNHLLLKKQVGRMVMLDGDVAYEGQYEGEGVRAKVLFVRIADRVCGFLGFFLRDEFDRGAATLDRLVERVRATSGDSR